MMTSSDDTSQRFEICLKEITAHIEKLIGDVSAVFHEIRSDIVHIDILHVKPSEKYPFNILVTSGMSDLAMNIPRDRQAPSHVELMTALPADWKMDQESFKNEEWYWPIRLLKVLARFPHRNKTWLGWGYTIPNARPPRPFAANTQLSGVVIFPPVLVPPEFHELRINDVKTIHFYSIFPLYENEMQLGILQGSEKLFDELMTQGITDVIDLTRKNISNKGVNN
jgi:hypothetical protein